MSFVILQKLHSCKFVILQKLHSCEFVILQKLHTCEFCEVGRKLGRNFCQHVMGHRAFVDGYRLKHDIDGVGDFGQVTS